MRKKIFSIVLSFMFIFGAIAPTPVYATSSSIIVDSGYLVDTEIDISELVSQANEDLANMSTFQKANVFKVLGSNIMLYFSSMGLTMSAIDLYKATQDMGYILSEVLAENNINNWGDVISSVPDLVRHVAGLFLQWHKIRIFMKIIG